MEHTLINLHPDAHQADLPVKPPTTRVLVALHTGLFERLAT
jgi:hypothetical protein